MSRRDAFHLDERSRWNDLLGFRISRSDPADEHLAGAARAAAEESARRPARPIAQNRRDAGLGGPHAKRDHLAESAAVTTGSAGVGAQRLSLHDQG